MNDKMILMTLLFAVVVNYCQGLVFISGYHEGASSNKALRISNSGTSDFNLNGYALKSAANGALWSAPTATMTFDSTYIIPAQQSLCFVGNNAAVEFKAANSICETTTNGVFFFNGDDAVGLFDDSGTLIDSVGQENNRVKWTVCGITAATENAALKRLGAFNNAGDFNTGAVLAAAGSAECEWEVQGIDVFTNGLTNDVTFGSTSPPVDAGSSSPSAAPSGAPSKAPTEATKIVGDEPFISGYVEGASSNKALRISNPSTSVLDLTGWVIKNGGNGALWSVTTNVLKLADLTDSTIPAEQSKCIVSTNASPEFKAENPDCEISTSGVLGFNGNDAIALVNPEGQVIDAVGNQGENLQWTVCGTPSATANQALRRLKVAHNLGNFNTGAVNAALGSAECEWEVMDILVLNNALTNDSFSAGLSGAPSASPSTAPTSAPSVSPSSAPSTAPSAAPTEMVTLATGRPTITFTGAASTAGVSMAVVSFCLLATFLVL